MEQFITIFFVFNLCTLFFSLLRFCWIFSCNFMMAKIEVSCCCSCTIFVEIAMCTAITTTSKKKNWEHIKAIWCPLCKQEKLERINNNFGIMCNKRIYRFWSKWNTFLKIEWDTFFFVDGRKWTTANMWKYMHRTFEQCVFVFPFLMRFEVLLRDESGF